MSDPYVKWNELRKLSDAELREQIEDGGPSALIDACQEMLAQRGRYGLIAAQMGNLPADKRRARFLSAQQTDEEEG